MSHSTEFPIHRILLADDDTDDCLLFKDVLDGLPLATHLTIVQNGQQLMQELKAGEALPDLVFLDLNMPRKNGFECLSEIKQSEKLMFLPVIIFSTSFQSDMVDRLYKSGAHHYICKPNAYEQLVKVIHHAISVTLQGNFSQPPKEAFVLSAESYHNELTLAKGDYTPQQHHDK